MSHLLAIAVGPVQEFIAAARRTRDLWFGSYLLSEISKAVAKSVKDQGGELIFPHPDTDLVSGDDKVNVANVILAELPHGLEPKAISDKAKEAAKSCWKKFADQAYGEASGVIRPKQPGEEKSIWDDQVTDVIEFYAAWVASTADYRADRGKLMRLLAGRKNCRDFLPAKGRDGVPKSSLDGQRESVLKPPTEWRERFRARLRIREGEQLDVVGLVKRVAEGNRPYPSVSRIAADPWVRGNKDKPAFTELLSTCQEFPQKVLHRLDKLEFPQFKDFPYEGTAVYVSRHHEWEEEIDEEDRLSIGEIQDALERLSQPNPYLAVLVADGDKMGAAISNLHDADANRQFSKTLAGFAAKAQEIVTEYNGVLVYAGGDDVLAFLPVDKCLDCARKLHDTFGELLRDYKKQDDESPTLSVGIAIGHFMENLEDLLDYGRDAEKAAKKVTVTVDGVNKEKDALAVHLHKRGGSPVHVASRWSDGPDKRLNEYARLINKEAIPGKLPYDLRKIEDVYKEWPQDTLVRALRADVLRVIRDKQPKAGRAYMEDIENLVNERLTDAVSLHRFVEELLVAKQIAAAKKQAGES